MTLGTVVLHCILAVNSPSDLERSSVPLPCPWGFPWEKHADAFPISTDSDCSIKLMLVMSRRNKVPPPTPPKYTRDQLQVERRARRKSSYHLVATRHHLVVGESDEEDDDDLLFNYLTRLTERHHTNLDRQRQIQLAKKVMLRILAQHAGDVTTPLFHKALDDLTSLYDPLIEFDAHQKPPTNRRQSGSFFRAETMPAPALEGMWISLQSPLFEGSLGTNAAGDFLYTLSRMTFGMISPGNLVCSIQGTFNPVHVVEDNVSNNDKRSTSRHKSDSSLHYARSQVGGSPQDVLRSYDVVTAFTIEPRDPKKYGRGDPNHQIDRPLEGLMTTKGFALPNPDVPNRMTVWFTEGSIEVVDSDDQQRWKRIFDPSNDSSGTGSFNSSHDGHRQGKELRTHYHGVPVLAPPSSGSSEKETITVVEPDGRISFKLSSPIGGQDRSHIDVLYLDESMRVMKSNRGDVFVFARLPHFPDE